MKKCILSIGVALLLGLFLVLSIANANGEVPVTVDAPTSVDEGVNFIVTVTIGAVTNFDACDYEVVFNSEVITLTSVTDGVIDGTTIPVIGTNEIALGRVKVVENVTGFPGVSGSGYLAELHFTVIGSDGTSSTINLEEGCLSDNTATEITATWTGDSVNVVALVADFTVAGEPATTEGYAQGDDETTFNFTGSATGGTTPYTAWAWTFGDAETGSVQNPTHIYTSAGIYGVVLTVTDTWSGTDTETKTDHVTVYDTLVADFSVDATEGYVGADVITFTFTNSSVEGKATLSYDWDFGDDTAHSDTTNSAHQYTTAAEGGTTYTVTLTTSDALIAVKTKQVNITVYPTLVAGFSGSTTETITEAIRGSTLHTPTVSFDSSTTTGGKTGYVYAWDFGDTVTSAVASPSHTYAPSGTKTGLKYTVTLTVDDNLTASDAEPKADYITIYQMGDIDENLTVKSMDITKIELIVLGPASETFTADANEDGNINAMDITKTEILVLAAQD